MAHVNNTHFGWFQYSNSYFVSFSLPSLGSLYTNFNLEASRFLSYFRNIYLSVNRWLSWNLQPGMLETRRAGNPLAGRAKTSGIPSLEVSPITPYTKATIEQEKRNEEIESSN